MGQVARIVPAAKEGFLRIGVHLEFQDFQAVDVRVSGAPASKRDASAFYVPGADSSGRYDVLLVSETFAQGKPLCAVRLGELAYDLQINHIRQKGRGWVAAGFEVIGVREALMTDQPLPSTKATASSLSLSLV